MSDEPVVTSGEPTPPTEPVQNPTEPTEPIVQEPGELDGLKNQLVNLEKKLGEQGNELGELRNENAFYRNQQQAPPQGPQNVGNQAGTVPVEEYDPYDQASVDRYFASKQKQVDERLNQFAMYNHQQNVNSALNRGKQIIQQNPEAFKGNENEVITMVSNLAMSGNIQADLIENPTTWYGVNDMVSGEKARKQNQVNPIGVTPIDTPAPVKTQEPEKQGNLEISPAIVKQFFGGDLEAATKAAREEQGL